MAKRKRQYEYRTMGSAAVDPEFLYRQESTARPLKKEKPVPRKAPKPKTKPAGRVRMEVSLFGVLGLTLVSLMLTLVIFGYAQVYASECQIGEMEDEIRMLRDENEHLQNKYDTSINLEDIENRAKELGMRQPSAAQIINLQVPSEDVTVVAGKTSSNFLVEAWRAVMDTARDLWDYLR